MRQDSENSTTDLHWHDGSTCHGAPTLQACLDEAIAKGWRGQILQRDDIYKDGTKVQCFSLISGSFEHWDKYGTFVAVVELTSRVL